GAGRAQGRPGPGALRIDVPEAARQGDPAAGEAHARVRTQPGIRKGGAGARSARGIEEELLRRVARGGAGNACGRRPGPMTRVLFVCTGNICRSPTAEGVFSKLVRVAGLQDMIVADSAGTQGYHVGEPPDERTCHAATRRGYDLTHLRARKFE